MYFLLTEVNEQPRKTECAAARPHQTSTAYLTLFLFLKRKLEADKAADSHAGLGRRL